MIFCSEGACIRGLGPRDPAACLFDLCVAASAMLSFAHKSSLRLRRSHYFIQPV